AAAAGRPQLSTPVGLAPDVLHPECLFTDPVTAAAQIESDFRHGTLRRWTPLHIAAVRAGHTVESNRSRWRDVYAALRARTPAKATDRRPPPPRAPRQFLEQVHAAAVGRWQPVHDR